MALDLFKRVETRKGLFAVEKITLIYNLLTSILILFLFQEMDHPVQMLADRAVIAGMTFLHDFAKEKEFTFSQLGLVTEYSVKGQLLGHLVMGAQEVSNVAAELGIPEDKSVLLQHMILSHHGEPEFGAAVKPICAESELLSQIDMLDSRMEIYRETLAGLQVGEVSSRIFALDKRVFKPHELNG